jgi:hypothetical protein
MSVNTKSQSKPAFGEQARPCRGYDAADFERAFLEVAASQPHLSQVRTRQRAWIEMFKRGAK